MLRLLCVAALLSSSRHAFPALLGADAAIGPYPHMTHASDLCSEEVHGYRRLATDQFAAVSDERQLLQAILNPNVVCAFVVVPRLDLTNDLATQVGVTMGESSCFRVTPPFCDWQIISRTLVIVPDRRLSHVEVLQSSVSIPSTARFTLAASAKIVMAGFKILNAFDHHHSIDLLTRARQPGLLNCTNEPAQFNKESLWDIFFGASLLQLSLNMGFKQQPAFGTLQIFNLTAVGSCLASELPDGGLDIDISYDAARSRMEPVLWRQLDRATTSAPALSNNSHTSIQMSMQCCDVEKGDCPGGDNPHGHTNATALHWTRVHLDNAEDVSWTLVVGTDLISGQAMCRTHGARLGALTSPQQYVKVLKSLLQSPVAHRELTARIDCELNPVVLWSGLQWWPGEPGWNFVDPPLSSPNAFPYVDMGEDPALEMLQLLLASPFVSVMCTFIHVVTLLMYSVPCPSPRTRGIYMCMKEAEASDYPQTLPPMDLVPLPPVKVESESTDRVMWSVAAAMLTVLIGTVAVFGWWLRKTAVQIQTSKQEHTAIPRKWLQAHSEYSEQMKLNELMSSDNNEAASVFLKQDIMHMTVLNRTGTQLQHSSVPRMGLFDALRSMVNNDADVDGASASTGTTGTRDSSRPLLKTGDSTQMFSNGVYEEMGHRSSSFRRLSEETAFQPVNVMSAGTGGGAAGGATIETTTPLVDEADVERGLGRTAAVDVTEEHVPAKQRSGSPTRERELQELEMTALPSIRPDIGPGVEFGPHSGYIMEKKVGSGGQGDCWLVTQIKSSRKYILKIPKGTATQLAVNEAFFIHILSHPNILRHKETIVCDERKINLVTEYCELGDVQTLVDMQLSFSEEFIIHATYHLACALHYLHANHIAHRDIKPSNVFLTASGVFKLADFGLSRILVGTSTTFTGTPVFMAPEILSGNPYTKESDIFSLGTTIYTMCMLRVPFQSIDIIQLRTMKLEPFAPLPADKYPQPLVDLVHSMLAVDVHDRPSAKQIVDNEWLREYCHRGGGDRYSFASEVRAKLFSTEDAISFTLAPLAIDTKRNLDIKFTLAPLVIDTQRNLEIKTS